MSPTHQDLSNDTTFSQIKSRVPVPVPLMYLCWRPGRPLHGSESLGLAGRSGRGCAAGVDPGRSHKGSSSRWHTTYNTTSAKLFKVR